MKKILLLSTIILITLNFAQAQNIGVGFQANFPSYGISVKADLNDTHTAQLVYGAFGTVEMISGRYIYNFSDVDFFTPFVYAQLGVWTYSYDVFNFLGAATPESESSFGYGIGGGLELNWLSFISDRLKWTLELGIGQANLSYYNFKTTSFGSGIHFHF